MSRDTLAFRAGASVVDITGPTGLDLGGGALGTGKAILHRLYARCLCFEQGDARLILVSCDVLGFDQGYASEIRGEIARATGVPIDAIMLTATHTHGAPATVPLRNWGQPDPAYCRELQKRLAGACVDATNSLRPARIGAAQAPLPGLFVNRSLGEGAPVDDTLVVVRIDDESGRPIAVIVNMAGHPVNLHTSGLVSSDYPHYLNAVIQQGLGCKVPVLFLQGAGGDLNPANFVPNSPSDPAASQTGTAIGRKALELLAAIEPREPDMVRSVVEYTLVPLAPLPTREELRAMIAERSAKLAATTDRSPTSWPYTGHKTAIEWAQEALGVLETGDARTSMPLPLQAMRLGPIGIIALPGELFSELGLDIRRHSPFSQTIVATLANGCCGYFPPPAAYEKKTYEAVHCPRYIGLYLFAPTVGRHVRDGALSLLRRLAG